MAVTIKDVAALAGVSPSTVSRTCKNNPSISEETKERVRKAMAELGYEPNFQASIWPLRFPAPSVLSCLRHRKKLMRILFTWRRSVESATTVTPISISAPLSPDRMKKRF